MQLPPGDSAGREPPLDSAGANHCLPPPRILRRRPLPSIHRGFSQKPCGSLRGFPGYRWRCPAVAPPALTFQRASVKADLATSGSLLPGATFLQHSSPCSPVPCGREETRRVLLGPRGQIWIWAFATPHSQPLLTRPPPLQGLCPAGRAHSPVCLSKQEREGSAKSAQVTVLERMRGRKARLSAAGLVGRRGRSQDAALGSQLGEEPPDLCCRSQLN